MSVTNLIPIVTFSPSVSLAISVKVAKRRDFSPVVDGEEDQPNKRVRMLGAWSARTLFLNDVAYVAVFVAGFASIRNTSDPLPDPYLAIAEILILVMAPIMVCLMLAIHQCAPKRAKPFTQVALGWMLAAAAFTTVVHFVQLTVARATQPPAIAPAEVRADIFILME